MDSATLMQTSLGQLAWPMFLATLLTTLEDPELTPGRRNTAACDLLRGSRPLPILEEQISGRAAEEPRAEGGDLAHLAPLLREAAEATSLLTLGQAMQGGVASDLPARLASAAEGAQP